MSDIIIRTEQPSDYPAILRLTYEAFLELDYPGRQRNDEHYLIYLLRESKSVIRELCLVAECGGEVIGHICFTGSTVEMRDGAVGQAVTFGPLSVAPKWQRQGVGTSLVRRGIEAACDLGYGAVIIIGVEDYYPRLGFARAGDFGLTLMDGSCPDSFMVYEIQPGYFGSGGAVRFLAPEFERSETDVDGFTRFHRQFISEYRPGELIMRPLLDGDISLMERWLNMPHVSHWYRYPQHWLRELCERRGTFAFITHFICEFNGEPIGFCQYYDRCYSRLHEIWNDKPIISERQGEIYGIDLLIGEAKYLRRGFGSGMIALLSDKMRVIGAMRCIASPESENIASCRALVANGFVREDTDYVFDF